MYLPSPPSRKGRTRILAASRAVSTASAGLLRLRALRRLSKIARCVAEDCCESASLCTMRSGVAAKSCFCRPRHSSSVGASITPTIRLRRSVSRLKREPFAPFHSSHASPTNSSLKPALLSWRLLFTEITHRVFSVPCFRTSPKSSRICPTSREMQFLNRAKFRLNGKCPFQHLGDEAGGDLVCEGVTTATSGFCRRVSSGHYSFQNTPALCFTQFMIPLVRLHGLRFTATSASRRATAPSGRRPYKELHRRPFPDVLEKD